MKKKKLFYPADVLLPKSDFESFSVIACDQYTSEPEYWQEVKENVGDKKSALNIVLPEVYLSEDDSPRIDLINKAMGEYLADGTFVEYKNSFVYLERTQPDGRVRHGLVGAIDLEDYDYQKDTDAMVRATEATILERIPPRVKIRNNAPLEMPHIMLLVDDRDNKLLGGLKSKKDSFNKLYDFTLMQNGGSIKGWQVGENLYEDIEKVLTELKENSNGLLFCVGDGNHSLATAKQCYKNNPTEMNRYALVEVVNIHDQALDFEPIYRTVFGVNPETLINAFVDYCGGEYKGADAQKFICYYNGEEREVSVKGTTPIAVGTLQQFLDLYMTDNNGVTIDYIHGEDSLKKIANREYTVGFLYEGIKKDGLFEAVRLGGSLPRKAFSMGHADDKRFYLEARRIK
ncbi:MAG: DUF1015 domain-containing protein [Ruminococcaceae bacterium]|nr:DUF1015 domain-containing protein [Oscillospiraceae bacterium]